MYSLIMMSLDQSEPVLLIGETGSGKTTVAELIAKIFNTHLYTVNCHQYTESSDFLGGLRPVRNKDKNIEEARIAAVAISERSDLPTEITTEFRILSHKLDTQEREICYELCLKSLNINLGEDRSELKGQLLNELESIKKNIDRIG